MNLFISTVSNCKITKSEDELTNKYKQAEDYASQTNPKYSIQEETTEKAQNHIRPRVPGKQITWELKPSYRLMKKWQQCCYSIQGIYFQLCLSSIRKAFYSILHIKPFPHFYLALEIDGFLFIVATQGNSREQDKENLSANVKMRSLPLIKIIWDVHAFWTCLFDATLPMIFNIQ